MDRVSLPRLPQSGTLARAVVAHAPTPVRPYLQVMRVHRPIGKWLAVLPGWWGLALGSRSLPEWRALIAVGVAGFILHGACCTLNDIVDRHIDAQIARTAQRPLACGSLSVNPAIIFAAAQVVIALMILWTMSGFAAIIMLATIPSYVAYPYMKRFMLLPPAFVGLFLNVYAVAGYAISHGKVGPPAFALWAAGFFWTLVYDTSYSYQDVDGDRKLGLHSAALLFGRAGRLWLAVFSLSSMIALVMAGSLAAAGWPFYIGLVFAAGHLLWQLYVFDMDSHECCDRMHVSNRVFGWIVFVATLFHHAA